MKGNLQRFIKNYWAALGGVALVLWLEVQMVKGTMPYGNKAQQISNILLLVVGFVSALIWNGRTEQRKAELLQIALLVCEAYLINVDVFSNWINHWSDLYTNGWNLTWVIGGSFGLLWVSGLFGMIVRSLLQVIFHLAKSLREIVRWFEQTVQKCDKSILFEGIGGIFADYLFINYLNLNQKPEQTILWVIGFGVLWIIGWTFIRLFIGVRKNLLVEIKAIPVRSVFSIICEGLILIGLVSLSFWSFSIQKSAATIMLVLLAAGILFVMQLKKIFQKGIFHHFWENKGITPEDLTLFILGCLLTSLIFVGIGMAQESEDVQIDDLTKLLEFFKTGIEFLEKIFP